MEQPKYIALFNQLKADIISQKYPPGSILPSENQLIEETGASRTTVRRALALLREDHYVITRQGQGSEVLPQQSEEYQIKKFNNIMQINVRYNVPGEGHKSRSPGIIDVVYANDTVAEHLKIKPGTPVYRIQRLQYVDDVPCAYLTHFLPRALVPNLEKHHHITDALYKFLETQYQIFFTHGEDVLNVRLAGFKESQFLNVEVGTPLLLFERVAYCEEGILEYSEYVVLPDIMQTSIPVIIGAKRQVLDPMDPENEAVCSSAETTC